MVSVIFFSCQDTTTDNKPPSQALNQSDALNNQAMDLLQQTTDTNSMVQALYLLDKAVALDSNNFAAYNNMMGVLLWLKKMDKANDVLDYLISKTQVPNYSLFKGFILERHYHDTVAAHTYYSHAYLQLDSLSNNGNNDNELLINKLLAQFMAYGQSNALQGLDSLPTNLKTSSSLEHLKSAIINNDRNIILDGAY